MASLIKGLNHDTTTHENGAKLAPEEIELRRRIVWAAFSQSTLAMVAIC
jgi:hypothetical protein